MLKALVSASTKYHIMVSIEVNIEARCGAPCPMPHAAAVEQKADHSILNITTATLLILMIRQLYLVDAGPSSSVERRTVTFL